MLIAYIYDKDKTRQITQIFGILSAEITEKLSDVGTAFFEIPTRTADSELNRSITLEALQEMNIVELWHSDGVKEEKFFTGYIAGIEARWEIIKISLKTLAGIFDHRIIRTGFKFQKTGLRQMMVALWNHMKDPPLRLICRDNRAMDKTYEIGRTMSDILRDITEGGLEYRIEDGILIVGENIGKNRSDVVQYRKEWQSPREWNIADMTVTYSASNTHNSITTKIKENPVHTVEDAASIAKYGYKEKYITVSGDKKETPSGFLKDHKESSREIKITPTENNFTHIDVGDFVGVHLDAGNDILKFSGALKITQKQYIISGDLAQVTLTVATNSKKSQNVMEKIKQMDERIGSLEVRE